MKQRNVGNTIVRYLLKSCAAFPGRTLGEIEVAAGLARGTASHQRITEKRKQGFPIKCHKDGDRWRYFIHRADAPKCAAILAVLETRRASKVAA